MTNLSTLPHPLPVETLVVSVEGEWDQDEDGSRRETGQMARGYIASVHNHPAEGWVYEVIFPAAGVVVNLTQADDPLDDPAHYRFGPQLVGNLRINDQGFNDAAEGEPLYPDADPDYAAGWQNYHALAALVHQEQRRDQEGG